MPELEQAKNEQVANEAMAPSAEQSADQAASASSAATDPRARRALASRRARSQAEADAWNQAHPALVAEFNRLTQNKYGSGSTVDVDKVRQFQHENPPLIIYGMVDEKTLAVARATAPLPGQAAETERSSETSAKADVKDGSVQSAEVGGHETIKDGERTTTRAASAKYDAKGVHIDANTSDAVETKTDSVKTTMAAKYEGGRGSVAHTRTASHAHEDGSKDGYHRESELGVSDKGADVSVKRGSSRSWQDDDGEHAQGRDYGAAAKVERDAHGDLKLKSAELSTSSSSKAGEHATTSSGAVKYDDKGVHVDAARKDTVETKDDKITTTASGKYDDGHVVVGGSRAASHTHEDGSKDGYHRDGELDVSRNSVAAKGAYGRSAAGKDENGNAVGNSRELAGGAKVERDKDGNVHLASASVSGTDVVTEGERTRTKSASGGWDAKKGLTLAASSKDAVETKTDAITTTTSGKFEGGRGSVAHTRTASHKHEDGSSDGYSRESEFGVSADGADASAKRSRTETHKDDDGGEVTNASELGGNVKVKDGHVSGGLAGKQTHSDDVGSSTKSVSAGFENGQLTAQAGHEKKLKVKGDDDNEQSVSNTIGLKNGKATAAHKREAKYKDADGNEHASGSSTTVSFDKDGHVAAGYGSSSSVKDADGNKASKSTNFGVDTEKKELSVGHSTKHEDKDGNVKDATSVGAQVGKDHVGGDVSVSKGKKNFSAWGKVTAKASDPQKVGNKWIVEWSASLGGGASGGYGKASVSAGGAVSLEGTKVFASQEEAKEFSTSAALRIKDMHGTPHTVDAAMTMQPGERIGEKTEIAGSVSGTANIEGASIGGGVNAERKGGSELARVSATVFEAEVSQSQLLGASFTEGGMGIKAGLAKSKTTSGKVRLRFDVGHASGKAALEAFLGEPRTITTGAELVSDVTDEEHKTSQTLGGLGAAAERTGTTHRTVEKTKEGETHTYTGEQSTSVSHKQLGEHQASEKFTGQRQLGKHGETIDTYELSAHVKSGAAQTTNQELAQASGTTWQPLAKSEKSSGTWDLSTQLTPEQVLECARNLLRHGDLSSLTVDYASGEKLVAKLRGSHDVEGLMAAFSDFVAANGAKGFAVIRENIGEFRTGSRHGGKHMQVDIALEGDANFLGRSGHAHQQAEIAQLQGELRQPKADRAALAARAIRSLQSLRHKVAAIGDHSRYHDLPNDLRHDEIQRLQGYIASLQAIADAVPPEQGGGSAAAPAASHGIHHALSARKTACHHAERLVNKSRWVHDGNETVNFAARTHLKDHLSVERYTDADLYYGQGSKALRAANAHEEQAEKIQAQMGDPGTDAAAKKALLDRYLQELQAATGQYSFAEQAFMHAESLFQAIRKSHPNEEIRMFVGYSRPFEG